MNGFEKKAPEPKIGVWRKVGSNPAFMAALFLLAFFAMILTGHKINHWDAQCPGQAAFNHGVCPPYEDANIPIIIQLVIDTIVGFAVWGPLIWVISLGVSMARDIADPDWQEKEDKEWLARREREEEQETEEDDSDNR